MMMVNQTDILKPYTCHKRVRASEIMAIGTYHTDGDGNLVRRVVLEGDHEVNLPHEMFTRYIPQPGDFYLLYEDGGHLLTPW